MNEIRFQRLQTEHYANLLSEVEVLLDKVESNIIKAVIKNGRERAVIDISLNYHL